MVADVLDPAKHGYPQDQTVLTLVKSIHRWIASGDGEQPSDFAEKNREKHARGMLSSAFSLKANAYAVQTLMPRRSEILGHDFDCSAKGLFAVNPE